MSEHFGEHLMVDGYEGDFKLLNNKETVLSCIDAMVVLLEMKKLAEPEIYYAKGNDMKDPGGWTGFVVIEESHISFHTFPKRGFISADVYTCRAGMNTRGVTDLIKETFQLKDTEVNFVKRGMTYPRENIY